MRLEGMPLSQEEREELSRFISRRYGLDFHRQRLDCLETAVQKRMEACRENSVASYLRRLQQREDEALRLVQLLTVHETYFFRESAQFELLIRDVLPRMLPRGVDGRVLRLLSAGCSTGEEAYSLAMAILNMPGAGVDWDFEVIGVDLDPAVIRKAQAGIYGTYSFRTCTEQIKNKYFVQIDPECWSIKECVKQKVHFATMNLFETEYPAQIRQLDVIFYRNVSIYFSRQQREMAFLRLAELLRAEGCLFLSCTETLVHHSPLLALRQNGDNFYYCKRETGVAEAADSAGSAPRAVAGTRTSWGDLRAKKRIPQRARTVRDTAKSSPGERWPEKRPAFDEALGLAKRKCYEEALACLEKMLAADVFALRAYTLKANILLNRQQIAAAQAACREALALDVFCLEAYLLLGMAAKLDGDTGEAVRRFKEAVYVQPECWWAHFQLAEVYQLRNEAGYARREYEVAAGILQRGNMDNHGLSLFVTPFQPEDFIQVCRHNIEKLRA